MKYIRKILERISRGRIFKRRIRVQNKSVPIYITPDAQLKYLKIGDNAFDRDLINIAEKYLVSDSHVWDIGANVGVFTFAAATVASKGTIVSVEADIWLAQILRRTSKLEQYTENDIRVLPIAISDQNSITSFLVAKRGRASNALEQIGGRSQMGGIRERQFVPTFTLDKLLEIFPPPNFVKIDVEGAELLVVNGAENVINQTRPIFYIEIGQECFDEVLGVFKQASYIALDSDGNELTNNYSFNVLFVPIEKFNK